MDVTRRRNLHSWSLSIDASVRPPNLAAALRSQFHAFFLRRKGARGKKIPSVRIGGRSPDEINASTAKTIVITERPGPNFRIAVKPDSA
jgi:hypothetical protein